MIKRYLHALWQRYIEPVDPFNIQLKQSIKICIIGSIAVLMVLKIYKLPPPQMMWPILSSLFIAWMYRGNSRKQKFFTQLLGGVIAAIGVYVTAYLGSYFILYLLIMIIATLVTFYLMKYNLDIFQPALLILIMISFSGAKPLASISDCWERFVYVLFGMLLAIVISNLLWPFNPRKLLRQNLQKGFQDIGKYMQFVIDNSLRGNFHRLRCYELKNKVMQSLQNLRILLINHGQKKDQELAKLQGKLFMDVAALSDIFNKPNSEYTLDILGTIAPKLHILASYISDIMQKPDKKMLQNIPPQIDTLKKIVQDKALKPLIIGDINCISFLLTELYETLTTIY